MTPTRPAIEVFLTTEEVLDYLQINLRTVYRLIKMDGLTLIRQARRVRSELPVIIITGFSSESSAIEAVNLGVASYLLKPSCVPDLLAAARKALGVPVAS